MLDMDFNLNKFYGKNDEELAALAVHDRYAVDALILRFFRLISIKAQIFSSDVADADDLRQEGLMGLMRAITSYNPKKAVKFSTYAEVCIVNSMKSYAAKCSNKSYETVSLDDIGIDAPSQEKNPESIYVDKEFFSELWRIIDNELSDLERQVFIFFIQGDGYHQISAELGISEKSVDNALQRARGKIRKKFSGMMPLK
mgnify:FL=1